MRERQGQCKSQPGVVRRATFGILAPEAKSELIQIGCLQIGSCVDDGQHPAGSRALQPTLNVVAFGRVFDGIAQEVGDDAFDHALIALHPCRFRQSHTDR